MNEAETRTHYILSALQQAGWSVVRGSRIREAYPIAPGRLIGNRKRSKALEADYVLQYQGRNLAVIEAKKNDLYYTDGVGQAKNYAKLLQVRVCYSTNGKQIYFIDRDTGDETDVNTYPSPDELWAMTYAKVNRWRDKFLAVAYEDKGGSWEPRYYQDNAINQAINAIANNKTRILLTLATGTGKTAIAFQIVWCLFQCKWTLQKDGKRTPRILFLTDRNILANQAFNTFSAFEEEALIRITPKSIHKKGKVPTNGSVFFTIFQSFMTEDKQGFRFGQYPQDFFDFIIIDECHRGGANEESRWRGIMDYFAPAVQLGLTATPKREINADTYHYFGEPVYIYSLKEGINDGFLTPFRVKQVSSNIDDYIYNDDDVIIEGEIDKSKTYTEKEMNRSIVIKEREASRIKGLLSKINQNDKTLVFCRTQKHALLIRDLINQHKSNKSPDYCHRVTADEGAIGEQHLRSFQDNEKTLPTILTTSHKLSTGVDAPEIKNIVLLRPVNSMVEFKQIIGRGTRLFAGKDYFTIYDFVGAYQHFNDPEWDGEPNPNICDKCGLSPCACGDLETSGVCRTCQQSPCICDRSGNICQTCGFDLCRCHKDPPVMIDVQLSNKTIRQITINTETSFLDNEGQLITAKEFLNKLFNDLPNFFQNEAELRKIWSQPNTRKKLREELSQLGYNSTHLQNLQTMIRANDSDLFDVLSYIAFNKVPLQRKIRSNKAALHLDNYDTQQQAFLNFVLKQYVNNGVDELDEKKLPNLLELKYHGIADAKNTLGENRIIRDMFIDFQQYLYVA